MGRIRQALLALGAVGAFLSVTSSASAASHTVCAAGCSYTSIQTAIDALPSGSTITIGPGEYSENIVVTKPVTLKGSGSETVIYPGTSGPTCSSGEGSICPGGSNIVLVEANDVTVTKLTLEGDNPALTSGVVVGGKDIDARNGLITNHHTGTYNNLTVSRVKVADVYLRGIYASSGGTFNLNHDTVQNVQAEGASIAMFQFSGSGIMSHNKVSDANDAISANHSTGTQFLDNTITKSGSGVHTDNNNDAGGTPDRIEGNLVKECKPDGYGIFVFVPYSSATVSSNKIKGCYIGLAVFGGAVTGQGPTFSNNSVNGTGAVTTDPAGSYGAYVTTDQLGFEFGDVTAAFTGNTLAHTGTGLFVTQTEPTPGQPAGGQATVTASNNTIHPNLTGANGGPGTVVEAQNDWWGCATGPNTPHCDTAVGTVNYTPWLTARP